MAHCTIILTLLIWPSLSTFQLLHRGGYERDHPCRETIARQEVPCCQLTQEVLFADTFELEADGLFRATVTLTGLDDFQTIKQRLDFVAPGRGGLRNQSC